MKTLEEHNKEAYEEFRRGWGSTPNGIACPKCGEELLDSRPQIIAPSWPPSLEVHCPSCDFKGARIK